jgi:hypothetical protein
VASVPIGLDFVPDGVGSGAVVVDAATLPFPVMAGLVEVGLDVVVLLAQVAGLLFGLIVVLGFLSGLLGAASGDSSGGNRTDRRKSRRRKQLESDGRPPTSGETYEVNDYGELVERDE